MRLSRPFGPRRARDLLFSAGLRQARRGGVGGITYLGSGGGTFNGILAFDSLDLLRFVVDDALNFRLV